MIVEVDAGDSLPAWTFQFQLPDAWRPLEQLLAEASPQLLEALRRAGISTSFPTPVGGELLFAAAMLVSVDPNDPPLIASVQLIEGPTPSDVSEGADVLRRREEDRFETDWPTSVGTVTYRRVRYELQTPSMNRSLQFVFSTPNLPEQEVMDAVFDTVVGSGAFYTQDAPSPAGPMAD
jgi:hypothetical protein